MTAYVKYVQLVEIHARVDPLLMDLCSGVKTGEEPIRVSMADALSACLPKVFIVQ